MSILLTTERCSLISLQDTDYAEAVDLFKNEQVREYLGGPITEEQAYFKLQGWQKSRSDIYLCVRLTETYEFAGIISVSPHHDVQKKELSYQFLPQYWGKGIAAESIKAVLDYLKNLFVDEIVSETQSNNTRSCALLEKLGFELDEIVFRFGAEQRIYKNFLK